MIIIGLTGSIGMGKSTTTALFREEGVPVYDADAAVHEVYAAGGSAVAVVEAQFPEVTGPDGGIDRKLLGRYVFDNPVAMTTLERIVHPILQSHREAFYASVTASDVVVIDVPLLFETGLDSETDATVVVSCPAAMQRERVLARPGMTEEKLAAILARQMPDVEKRARADFVIKTGNGIESVRTSIRTILSIVRDSDFVSNRATV